MSIQVSIPQEPYKDTALSAWEARQVAVLASMTPRRVVRCVPWQVVVITVFAEAMRHVQD